MTMTDGLTKLEIPVTDGDLKEFLSYMRHDMEGPDAWMRERLAASITCGDCGHPWSEHGPVVSNGGVPCAHPGCGCEDPALPSTAVEPPGRPRLRPVG